MLLFLILVFLPTSSAQCTFSVLTITSTSQFPANCSRLEGRFRVDQTSELTDSELSDLFANVHELVGVVQIWNSALTTANFLANVRRITGDVLDNAISILNNTQLTSLNLTSLEFSNGKVNIQNNPLLDLKSTCSSLHGAFFNRRAISGNKFDCGCDLPPFFKWPATRNFPNNCIVLYGNLVMKSPAPPPEVLYRLMSATKLYGFIHLETTNLETLGFLQNLEEIESGPDAENTIYISSNTYLARLDLIRLYSVKSLNSKSQIQISGSTCLDPAFVQLLLHSDIQKISLSGSFCPLNRINNPSFYCTGPISKISDRCNRYLGNIVYLNPDSYFYMQMQWNYTVVPEKEWKKIQQLEYIFGALIIEGSSMKEISLPNLQEIYQIDTYYAPSANYANSIYIGHNYKLKNFNFPKLQYSYGIVRFERNDNLTTDDSFCRTMTDNKIRISVGTHGDYNCRDYLMDETTTVALA